MARHLYVAGIDRWRDYERGTMQIEAALTYQIDTCRFQVRGERPGEGEEVIIEDDNLGRLFAGVIVKVELARVQPDKSNRLWQVDCDDYTALLDRRLVVETYENLPADEIFRDIVAKYCPGFTVQGVQSGAPVVEFTGAEFEYKRPSECFKWLCDYVGWHWEPDYFKDLHFFSAEELASPAPMTLVPGGKFRFGKHTIDTQGLRNRVYVRGGTMLSDPQVIQWKADGVARIWTLPWGPHEVSLAVGEVPMTVGVENLHEEADFDYMMSFTEKYIRCSSHTPTPVAGITMALTARQDIPVITMVEDYASQAAIAKVQGGDGIYEHVISDDSLISIAAAEAAGMADLREHSNPRVKGSFETEFSTPPEIVERLIDEAAVFTRTSKAYLSDGTQVAANVPRFEPGMFGQAVMVEEGTTNVFTNSGFESGDTTGWGGYAHSGTGTWSVGSGCKRSGSYGARIDGGSNGFFIHQSPGTNDQVYSISFKVKREDGAVLTTSHVQAVCNNAVVAFDSITAIGDGWYICEKNNVTRTTGTWGIKVAVGVIIYVDECQMENKAYSTSYHGSTRSPESLTIPTAGVLNPQEGTVKFRVKVPIVTNYNNFFSMGTSNGRFLLFFSSAGQAGFDYGANNSGSIAPAGTIEANNWYHIVLRWSATTGKQALFINGVKYERDLPNGVATSFPATVSIVNNYSAYIDDLRISSRARTDEEIADAYSSGQPLSVDENTTLKMSFNGTLEATKGVLVPTYWQPGQIVDIRLSDRGVEGEYLIQRVTITPTWSNPSIWTFRVEYGGRLLGIADFLKALVSAQQKKRVIEPTKNVQKYIYGEETLTVGDELITATRGLPFVCGDADAVCGLVVVSNG